MKTKSRLKPSKSSPQKRTNKSLKKSKKLVPRTKLIPIKKKRVLKKHKVELGTPEFRKLRLEWYKKLESHGFDDLEYFTANEDDPTRYIQAHSLSAFARYYKPETLHYYRRWSCFLVYCHRRIKLERDRAIVRLYTDGVPFREIVRRLRNKYDKGVNITSIHFLIRKWLPEVVRWNKISPHGLDFESDLVPSQILTPNEI